jgi:coproporphyrinogen III oxidase-like Fe-S oxidoreductase
VIEALIAKMARREFSRSMRFEEGSGTLLPRGTREGGRLLYLHIPFCENLCAYCSFNRVLFDEALCRRYFAALRKEMTLYRERGYNFQGIYVGGGTPTILMDEMEKTLSHARGCFDIREISVETNPNHLTGKTIESLRRTGVNRLSVGIQSFDDGLLTAMGRYNSYGSGSEIRERLINAKGYFDTLNADMIFNFPIQTREALERDIDILIEAEVDQVTYYPLMVSDSTRSAVERTLGSVDYKKERDFYHLISRRLTPHYRFSSAWCFSRKDAIIDEYIVDYDDYAGLGSGSIGYLDGRCYANTFYIPEYIERLEKGEIPLMASRDFSLQDRLRYDFVMKLFGMDLDLNALGEKYGRRTLLYLFTDIAAFFCAGGLRYSEGALHLTGRGRYYWVIMMREFFTAVNNFRDFCLNARGADLRHG